MPWPQVITPYPASSVTQICCIFCALLFMLIYYAFKSSWVDHKVVLVTRVQALFFAMMNCHILFLTAGADTPTICTHAGLDIM